METQLSKYEAKLLTPDLVDWFVQIACVGMLTNELKRPDLINLEHLYKLTNIVIGQGTAFVAVKDGVPIGAIAGLVTPSIYNPSITVCSELFWYVLPEFRASRAGILLLNAFVECGDRLADETTFSLLAGSTVNDKTLEKRGFTFVESGFIKYNRK